LHAHRSNPPASPARAWRHLFSFFLAAALACIATLAAAQSRNLAPGFTTLPKDAKVVVAPMDVELFLVTGGGVTEPKADWTDAAIKHMKSAFGTKAQSLKLAFDDMDPKVADDNAELLHLHAAVARSISLHHAGFVKLPTKDNKLDWSFGDSLRPLQQATGARYGLFTWVRDSYASAERKAMMGVVAVLSLVATAGTNMVLLGGGVQTGYATLVDMETGQVLWFNQLLSSTGDLREIEPAKATVDALMKDFPAAQ
jgi:hypothetical protein